MSDVPPEDAEYFSDEVLNGCPLFSAGLQTKATEVMLSRRSFDSHGAAWKGTINLSSMTPTN